MRGRLIQTFQLEIAQLDTIATSLVPDGGYDDVFREPIQVDDGTALGQSSRRESLLRVHAQVEPAMLGQLRAAGTGTTRDAQLVAVIHFYELERKKLVGADGQPLLRIGDRLHAIHDNYGELVQLIPTPPGLYLRDATPIGFGLGAKRNLLQLSFVSRATAR